MTIFGRKQKPASVDATPPVPRAMTPRAAPPVVTTPTGTMTDEGVPYQSLDTSTVLNISTDRYDARRRELHIHGTPYQHVTENVVGQWIYRHDQ